MLESSRKKLETRKEHGGTADICTLQSAYRNVNNFVFGLSQQTSKVRCMYLAIKNLKIMSKKVSSIQKAKSKVEIIFFKVKFQQDRCRWCNYKLNRKNKGNNLLTSRQRNTKVPSNKMFLNIKLVTKRWHLHFWTLLTNNKDTVYKFSV